MLLDMLLFARRVRDRIARVTKEEFDSDEDLQYSLTYFIQTIGEAATRSSQQLRETYPEVPWARVIGMRHRLVHDYLRVRADIVWETATSDMSELVDLLEAIIRPEAPPP